MSQVVLILSAVVQAIATVVLVFVTRRYVRLCAETLGELKRSTTAQEETIFELRRAALIQACAPLADRVGGPFGKELERQANNLARQVNQVADRPAGPAAPTADPHHQL